MGFESIVEEAAIEYLRDLGYEYVHGPETAPDGPYPERASYSDVILADRLRTALTRINPHLDSDALGRVARQILRPNSPSLEENNLEFQQRLTRGVDVQIRKERQIAARRRRAG